MDTSHSGCSGGADVIRSSSLPDVINSERERGSEREETDGWVGRWVGGLMDGGMGGRVDEWMDRWMDEEYL